MATREGGSKGLDALIVALNQACDGQRMRWHTYTLELPLVSLELCGVCRSAQLLHVRVHEDTPPTLWTSRTSRTTPSQRNPEVCISNRVPPVQAFGWAWKLPMDRLPQRGQRPSSCAARVGPVVWPPSLKQLVFDDDMEIIKVSWPASVQQLCLTADFDQPIVGAMWPACLQ
ncbi:unnamed protein product [Ectocarpus sp. 12 AP-2014]